ncbi:GNAT family N-acetyltransferase [Streptomyces antimycoticus]|uniref:N-acetyltransferase GCN5 n=1 Tax=Streptomyces antimycoticus TaxID=68175 RepID=A0A4D4K641_9ACTN|nr:GNAT family N-acetyltransferase [Streptomyces antimycoticus]BBJ42030.1 N-acetyltransferase GCN5 [Streptomyces antimycoticus]GDY44405.1 N-acetyltransferase GCN5 [Streptomyces antimycoticus]
MSGGASGVRVRLEPWEDSASCRELLRGVNSPEMTSHLGGPESEEQILVRHRRYAELTGPGAGRMYRIVLLPGEETVGSIGYWEREWRGESVYETGWAVLPPFQGRGIAAAAAGEVARAAAAQRTHRYLHAYPSVGHPASNGVCRKAGFTLVGECEVEYPLGTMMRCNDWRLELRSPS